MPKNFITINDVKLNTSVGRSMSFHGKHSGSTLWGVDLDFSICGQENIKKIEKLFSFDTVQVDDPFVNRKYKASLRLISCSYQEGREERHYVANLRELDAPPKFNLLEIDGHQFSVLKYKETECEDDVIGRYALLRLSKDQFEELQELLKHETMQIRRINIDEEPITMKLGGNPFWSKHEGSGEIYYKQIINLFPPDYSPKYKLRLASSAHQIALAIMVMSLSIRLEALINELVRNNVINEEKRNMLLQENWKELLDITRKEEIVKETNLQLCKVPDAEEEFD